MKYITSIDINGFDELFVVLLSLTHSDNMIISEINKCHVSVKLVYHLIVQCYITPILITNDHGCRSAFLIEGFFVLVVALGNRLVKSFSANTALAASDG